MNIDNVSEQSIYIVLCSLAVEKGKENEEKEETNERRFFEIFENLKKKQSLRKKVFYIYIRTGQRGISSADCPFVEREKTEGNLGGDKVLGETSRRVLQRE